jgi:hypothetical protein
MQSVLRYYKQDMYKSLARCERVAVSEGVDTEAEDAMALESATKQRLMKTADRKDLVRPVVNYRICKLPIVL